MLLSTLPDLHSVDFGSIDSLFGFVALKKLFVLRGKPFGLDFLVMVLVNTAERSKPERGIQKIFFTVAPSVSFSKKKPVNFYLIT